MRLKRFVNYFGLIAIVGTMMFSTPVMAAENPVNIIYEHDPRINIMAMEDIEVDESAVYGFRPSKDSVRLSEYANMDWSDPVSVEGWRQERIEYLHQFDSMYDLWEKMYANRKSTEDIARAVSAKRNEIRIASYGGDVERIAMVKKSNLDTYGNENGPTPESLFAKYGSWEKVIIKSFSSNSGMDACLGLYDMQYEHNKLVESIIENDVITYTVKNNDSLSRIAKKYFGTQNKWKDIYEVNKGQIKSFNIIYEGQKLIIPLR